MKNSIEWAINALKVVSEVTAEAADGLVRLVEAYENTRDTSTSS